ncbi:MAG: ATP-binding protein, partial [Planctomycetota bacterium]
ADLRRARDRARSETAMREGLRAALAFPIAFGASTQGAVELYTAETSEPDDELLHLLGAIGSQIGQYLERKRVEEETRRREQQLRQSQKMEAIGQLAGGVAHDFNNLLTVMMGHGDAALHQLRDGDPLRANLAEIRKAAERATALTRQLLAFSRKQVLTPKVFTLNLVVTDLEKMLRRLIGENIELVARLDPELGRVRADVGQIEQVLMNLVVNARDAMPNGGRLTIETRNATLDAVAVARMPGAKAGDHVLLSVSDTGVGMDKSVMARLFEPFFTTKEHGKGTGLGLATVYGIVKQSGGWIGAESEPGKGSTFSVYLPIVIAPATTIVRPAARPASRGHETILLVEDEAGVRALVTQILRGGGYTVLDASEGGEALLICERHRTLIDLMVTDVIMPRMSGRELAERLAPLRPAMKTLYLSGHTDDVVLREGLLKDRMDFLHKPFTADDLLAKVREVLDRAPAVAG